MTITSYGVKLRLPVFESDGVTVAVLLCEDGESHFGLILQRDSEGKDLTRRRYYAGCAYATSKSKTRQVARMADLGDNLYDLRFNGKRVEARWRTIFIVPSPPDSGSRGATVSNLTINCDPTPAFRFPHWLVSRFAALQFEVYQVENPESHTMIRIFHRTQKHLYLLFGICQDRPRSRWAKIIISRSRPLASHDCSKDHIDSWTAQSKDFYGGAGETARLSFVPCKRQPETTLVIHVELLGRLYEEMLREAHVSFPSCQRTDQNGRTPPIIPNPQVAFPSSHPPSPIPSRSQRRATPAFRRDRFV